MLSLRIDWLEKIKSVLGYERNYVDHSHSTANADPYVGKAKNDMVSAMLRQISQRLDADDVLTKRYSFYQCKVWLLLSWSFYSFIESVLTVLKSDNFLFWFGVR